MHQEVRVIAEPGLPVFFRLHFNIRTPFAVSCPKPKVWFQDYFYSFCMGEPSRMLNSNIPLSPVPAVVCELNVRLVIVRLEAEGGLGDPIDVVFREFVDVVVGD